MMTKITDETRADGYQAVFPLIADIGSRALDALRANPAGLTCEKIAEITGDDIHSVRSRMTEHKVAGRARPIGKEKSKHRNVMIAVWKANDLDRI